MISLGLSVIWLIYHMEKVQILPREKYLLKIRAMEKVLY